MKSIVESLKLIEKELEELKSNLGIEQEHFEEKTPIKVKCKRGYYVRHRKAWDEAEDKELMLACEGKAKDELKAEINKFAKEHGRSYNSVFLHYVRMNKLQVPKF